MTKFVLHGGFNKEKEFIRDDFFQEMLKDAPSSAKVLLVYFAESDEIRPLRIEQGKNQFEKNKGSKDIEIKIASPDSFIEECKWADVIFFSGGRTKRLMEVLEMYPDLTDVLKGKIIGGDSAGANVWGHLFYSKNTNEIGEGLKILPFKIVVHYRDGAPNPLGDIRPDLETLLLKEYETKVFNQ